MPHMKAPLILTAILCLASFSFAAQPKTEELTPNAKLALEVYAELGLYMDAMHSALSSMQDKTSAEEHALHLSIACGKLKAHLDIINDPYQMLNKCANKTDRYHMLILRGQLLDKGAAVQAELMRLAEVGFYGSAKLIHTLQELEMLDDDASDLIQP